MPRCLRIALLLFALSTLAGCYKATFVNPSVQPGPSIERWTNFYLFGLVGHEEIDVRLLCPGEVASIRTGGNVGTEIVTAVTFGIYAPRKIYVTCSGATTPQAPSAAPSPPNVTPGPVPVPPLPPDASAHALRGSPP
jgi:hypothetical protein